MSTMGLLNRKYLAKKPTDEKVVQARGACEMPSLLKRHNHQPHSAFILDRMKGFQTEVQSCVIACF